MAIDNLEEVESSLGMEAGTLQAAITSEEAVKIELPAGKFYDTSKHVIRTTEDDVTFMKNFTTEHDGKNKTAGLEVGIKDYKASKDWEIGGKEGKTIDGLVGFAVKKALTDAGLEPDAKVLELQGDIATLQGINKGLTGDITTMKEESTAKDNRRAMDKKGLESIKGERTLSSDRILTLFKAEHEIIEEDGKIVVKKGGQVMKNAILDSLSLDEVMGEFAKEFAKEVDGGDGGGDNHGNNKKGSMAAFLKEMDGKPQSEINAEMQTRIANKTLEA